MREPREIFASKGLRCTKQRVEVYRALAGCRCHPTAEQLHTMVQDALPEVSLATVYNTLEMLHEAGLCQRITSVPGGARYDADMDDHMHVVTEDGRLIDVPHCLTREIAESIPAEVLAKVERTTGVRIEGLTVQFSAAGGTTSRRVARHDGV
mgnify:CR=1 FL=1